MPSDDFNFKEIVRYLIHGAMLSTIIAFVRCAYDRLSFFESILYATISTGVGTLAYYLCSTAGFTNWVVIAITIGTALIAREVVGIIVESAKRLAENPLLTLLTILNNMVEQIPKFKKQLEEEEKDRLEAKKHKKQKPKR